MQSKTAQTPEDALMHKKIQSKLDYLVENHFDSYEKQYQAIQANNLHI